jgi:spore coat polysaccharide biosynthesis predicted glycosyltransferase SpsG
MLPKKVIFAGNANEISGAGHVKRLFELAGCFPKTVEKYFFGQIEFSWLSKMGEQLFCQGDLLTSDDDSLLVILDSYDKNFCLTVALHYPNSYLVQIADRYSFLLPKSQVIFMDLPFYESSKLETDRVLAHGIEYLPIRDWGGHKRRFLETAQKVLITTGGTAKDSIIELMLDEFQSPLYSHIVFNFIGNSQTFSPVSPNIHFTPPGSIFDSLAMKCDTAFSAAGTTMWDLLSNNIISGLFTIVQNQETNFDFAIDNGLAIPVLNASGTSLEISRIRSLLLDLQTRKIVFDKMSEYKIEGGAKRSVDLILNAFAERCLR